MIIIGEKINGAIPSIKQAIAEKNETLIIERTLAQAKAGANFLDCAPSTATEIEYETMVWLIGLMQGCTDVPLCIDSPNANLLARIIEEGHLARPGMVNSVNEEGDKLESAPHPEMIFSLVMPFEVKKGDIIASAPEGALGADVHASIDGKIESVTQKYIKIVR